MQKSDNNIVNLFEKSNPGFHKCKIAESINMKRGGVDLDALFAKGVLSPPSSSESFPALPDDVAGRLEVMRTYSAKLQSLGIEQGTFEERKVISTAIRKLRYNSPDLRPNEIGELQLLYEKLRQNQNRGRA